MTEKINSIEEIKNQLNEVINFRKETISKIESYKRSKETFEKDLTQLKLKSPNDKEGVSLLEIQIAQFETLISTAEINNDKHVYNIDKLLTTNQSEIFNQLNELFEKETIIYSKVDNTLQKVVVTQTKLDYITCQHKALQFETKAKEKLIIYPTIIMLEGKNNSFYLVPTSELTLKFLSDDVDQTGETIADKKDNYRVEFFIPEMLNEVFYFEDQQLYKSFETIYTQYHTLLQTLNNQGLKGIKKEYYNLVDEFGTNFYDFVNALGKNEAFLTHVSNENSKITAKHIESLGLIDLLKCFNEVADIKDAMSNESFAIMFLQSKMNGLSLEKYEDIIKLNDKSAINHYSEVVQSISNELKERVDEENFEFNLAAHLQRFDKDLHSAYLSKIYQFASLVIKADGKVTRKEEDALRKIMNLSGEKSSLKVLQDTVENSNEKTLELHLYDLYDLTGLQTVKQEINTLINLIKVKKAREDFDLKNTDMSLHIVFSGNPGTGKTTVARHLSKIYKCLGVLKKGHLVETDRSGLIAEYVGQTAIKVNKLVDSALDGVLFIDEAYAILTDEKDTYGKEAISTLLKRMEDDRDRLIVVLAGYTDQMAMFINSNPGLKSRFNKYIDFPDYTADELYSIFIGMIRKLNFKLEPSLPDKLKLLFLEEIEKGDTSFGNGRFVRNVFEKMLENQANRLSHDTELTKEKLVTLKVEDLGF